MFSFIYFLIGIVWAVFVHFVSFLVDEPIKYPVPSTVLLVIGWPGFALYVLVKIVSTSKK